MSLTKERKEFEPPYALTHELDGLVTDIIFEQAEGPGVMRTMRQRAAEIRQELLRLEYEYYAPERRKIAAAKRGH